LQLDFLNSKFCSSCFGLFAHSSIFLTISVISNLFSLGFLHLFSLVVVLVDYITPGLLFERGCSVRNGCWSEIFDIDPWGDRVMD
jgi:hypothetical protein